MKEQRITQLDGLRALAVLAVFLHHAYHFPLLWMGVDLFFILSGFLITGILLKENGRPFASYIGNFYRKRVRRILPPYLVLLILASVIFPGAWLRYWFLYLGGMNFLLPFNLPHLSVLDPLWSLAVEEQFYLLWPLAIFWLSRRQLIYLSAALIVAAPVLRYFCPITNPWGVYMLLPYRMDTLATGSLLALLWPCLQARLPDIRLAWIAAGLTTSALVSLGMLTRAHYSTYGNTHLGNLAFYECTLALMTSAFLMALSGCGKRPLSIGPLVWMGKVSYSFYLIHLLALSLVPHHYAVLALAVSILYAALSWYMLEKPILTHRQGSARPSTLNEFGASPNRLIRLTGFRAGAASDKKRAS